MIHKILRDKKVILASKSPRRKDIFKMLRIKTLQIPSHIEEKTKFTKPYKIVKDLALQKAKSISKNLDYDCVIVAADTIVAQNGKIFEKPRDKHEAFSMIQQLSGTSHYVYTGISVIHKSATFSDYAKTKVKFKTLSEKEINDYVSTAEPYDKAGGYGIQGLGSQFIDSVSGCFYNVMGFPVNKFYDLLNKIFPQD